MLLLLLNEPGSEEAERTSEEQEVNITTLDILEEQLNVKKDTETEEDLSKSKSESTSNKSSQEELLVTEEMTAKFPSLKGLEGKPITSVAEQYQSMNKDYQGTKREMAEMKKQIEILSKTQSSKEEIKPEEEEKDIPDPLLDKKGFDNYLKGKSLTQEQVEDLVGKAIEKRDQITSEAKTKANETQGKIMDALVEQVPEGMDPLKAMNTFFSGHPELLNGNKVKPEVLKFYSHNIELFANTIGSYIKSTLSAEEITKRAKTEAYKHMKNNLETAQETKKATDTIKPRIEEKLSKDEEFVSTIIANSYNPEDWNMPGQEGQ